MFSLNKWRFVDNLRTLSGYTFMARLAGATLVSRLLIRTATGVSFSRHLSRYRGVFRTLYRPGTVSHNSPTIIFLDYARPIGNIEDNISCVPSSCNVWNGICRHISPNIWYKPTFILNNFTMWHNDIMINFYLYRRFNRCVRTRMYNKTWHTCSQTNGLLSNCNLYLED